MSDFDGVRDAFLHDFWTTHPVDATFAGVDGFDHLLPPADRSEPAREQRALTVLRDRLAAAAIPDTAAARIDAHLMRGYIASTIASLGDRSRYRNPAWYTGEIAFGIVALLLPTAPPGAGHALAARIAAIPDALADARAQLTDSAAPADWVRRARLESAAIRRLLASGLPLHPLAARIALPLVDAAAAALEAFDAHIAQLPNTDPAAGLELFIVLARDVHGLADAPAEIERTAAAEFARLLAELEAEAARLDCAMSWRDQVAALSRPDVEGDAVEVALNDWHRRAMRAGADLVTPADDYGLDFRPLPDWTAAVYDDLYFLFYRSPPARHAGRASVYWVTAPQTTAAIKIVHAVHHGSIGHHTQNARARTAAANLARIAGSDGAAGIALLGGGSLGEGWACYAEELLDEVPGFYTPQERLLLRAFELRNVAACLGDLRLHTGVWNLDEMRAFYRDDAAFPPARIWSETTRNSIFPTSRIMYWLGTRQIRALRKASPLPAKIFHDRLLAYGAAPVAVVGAELAAADRR